MREDALNASSRTPAEKKETRADVVFVNDRDERQISRVPSARFSRKSVFPTSKHLLRGSPVRALMMTRNLESHVLKPSRPYLNHGMAW